MHSKVLVQLFDSFLCLVRIITVGGGVKQGQQITSPGGGAVAAGHEPAIEGLVRSKQRGKNPFESTLVDTLPEKVSREAGSWGGGVPWFPESFEIITAENIAVGSMCCALSPCISVCGKKVLQQLPMAEFRFFVGGNKGCIAL